MCSFVKNTNLCRIADKTSQSLYTNLSPKQMKKNGIYKEYL